MAIEALSRLNVLIDADTSEMERALEGASAKLRSAGEKMSSVGKKLTTFVTLPLAGIGAASFKMAADAQEAASKMEAVFGEATASMNAWIGEIMATVPATRAELQAMTSEIQDLLVPLGMVPGEAQAMTQQVVQLAADLASFNNIPMDLALEKIRAGLVGSYEPLLSFGVALNASTVEAKALEMGLIAEGEALDANARAQAAFQLILEGTTAAHGDAARTTDSAANSMKFFSRDVQELANNIGSTLLPAITPLIQSLTEVLGWFNELSPTTQKWVVAIGAIAAAVGPVLGVLGTFVSALGAVFGAVGPVIAILGRILPFLLPPPTGLIAGALVALAAIWLKWGDDIKAFVVDMVENVTEWFTTMKTRVSETVSNMVEAVRSVFVGTITQTVDAVKGQIDRVVGFFANMSDVLVGHSIIPDMVEMISAEFGRMGEDITGQTEEAVGSVEETFGGLGESLPSTLAEAFDAVDQKFNEFRANVPDAIKPIVDTVAEFWGKMKTALNVPTAEALADNLKRYKDFLIDLVNFLQKLWKVAGGIVSKIAQLLAGWLFGQRPNPNPGAGGGINDPAFNRTVDTSAVAASGGTTVAGDVVYNVEVSMNVAGPVFGDREHIRQAARLMADDISKELATAVNLDNRLRGNAHRVT